ncbi:GspE/PulE family protein [Thermodesulfovibrio hydrogeniphilus]
MRLGDLLVSQNIITQEELYIGLNVQKLTGEAIGECLVRLGFITYQELAEILAIQQRFEYVDLRLFNIPEALIKKVSKDTVLRASFLPLREDEEFVSIAIIDPANLFAIDTAKSIFRKKVKAYLTDKEGFYDTIEKAYYFIENPTDLTVETVNKNVLNTGTVPAEFIPTLVEAILAEGIRRGATDIHIMMTSGVLSVMYRVDGILQYGYALHRALHSPVVTRIKILSKLDIAEQRLPQDGSFVYSIFGRNFEVRVSTIPTIEGESVVMRILFGGSQLTYSLRRLGFTEELVAVLKELIRKPHGIIIVVGPTGSGKSTTLYALLREVPRIKRAVVTIEDPVEYRLSFVKQSQVNERINYDFKLAGRNFMRHDPDIILLGEIRDEETAQIAIRASITGHLVLSTLHTNEAVTSIARLFDLGIDRFMLSTSLLGVLSQRLVRKICPYCKDKREPNERELKIFKQHDIEIGEIAFGKGCALCNFSGYIGRMAVGELLVVNDEIRDLIYAQASISELQMAAMKNGMIPIKIDGLKKIAQGLTTLEELERIVG